MYDACYVRGKKLLLASQIGLGQWFLTFPVSFTLYQNQKINFIPNNI